MQSYVPAYLRSKNRGVVYQLLLQYHSLSKADIAKLSNLTFPTVKKVIEDFLQLGLVSEGDSLITSETGLGRKSQMIKLNENSYGTVGIFFEGNLLHIGLVNLCHEIIDQIYYPLQKDPSQPEEYEQISEKMADAVYKLQRLNPQTKILSVAIGMPGVVDCEAMTFRRWGKLYDFYEYYRRFNTSFMLPVYIENDMNAASLGEMIIRDDPRYSNLVYISIGTGIGAGLIINNQIWHGNAYLAGDLGMALNRLDLTTPVKDLSPLRINNQINAQSIMKHFNVDVQRDTSCPKEKKQEISQYIAERLLPIIYNLKYILDINNTVVSGSVTEFLGSDFFDCINSHLTTLRKIDNIPIELNIVPSIDSEKVGIVGAAEIALEHSITELLS